RHGHRDVRAIAAIDSLDIAECPFDAPTAQERVVRVERSATPAAVAVRLPLRKDFLVKLFRKEKLACNDLVAAEKHLEMDVRRAAAVPARIDGAKVDLP